MSLSFHNKKIGFLGAGQLARMMCQKASELGFITFVMSNQSSDPAAQIAHHWVKGDLYNQKDLENFLAQVDIATFESEFLNAEVLKKALSATKTPLFPQLKLMHKLQDRLTQKQLLQKYKIPTSPFYKASTYTEAKEASDHFGHNFVLKQRHHGYDGYGTYIIKRKSDLTKLNDTISQNPHGFIAEKFIPFDRELAISVARNKKGEIEFFPCVETYQENARCLWVKGPVSHPQLSSLKTKIKTFLESEKYVGIIAFELFQVKNKLLVNEIAPRVHNSAHYSLNATNYDQFQVHLLAGLNQTLFPITPLKGGFAMYNLLASGRRSKASFTVQKDIFLHWYGKKQFKPGRKMGHLNTVAESADKALKKLLTLQKEYKV